MLSCFLSQLAVKTKLNWDLCIDPPPLITFAPYEEDQLRQKRAFIYSSNEETKESITLGGNLISFSESSLSWISYSVHLRQKF